MAMTIHEFAERIGVSTATIWRAVNNQTGISPRTREMVLERMRELDYRPNTAAQMLVTGRSRIVGLWMPSLTHPYESMVLYHFQNQALAEDYEILIRYMDYAPPEEVTGPSAPRWPVAGAVLLDPRGGVRDQLREHGASAPVVNMGAYCDTSVDYVQVDLGAGAYEATRHLLEGGRRNVAYLVPPHYKQAGDGRYEGYMRAMGERGCEPAFIHIADGNAQDGLRAVEAALREGRRFDGLFCFNDVSAIGAYRALRKAGLQAPEDVALVGCDGILMTEYLDTQLSTVVQPINKMCQAAWRFLMRRLERPDAPRQGLTLTPRLVIRESSP
jgi:DNA-binding LacI/PurR family transcriptional regulator